ncbi:MAG: hypothetical protein WD969_10845 [Paracoccaceae bacterium]
MADRSSGPMLYANMAVLVSFGWLAILIGLAPIDARAAARPSPDLLFCVAAFLAIRRPSATPAILVLLLGLVRDVIGGAPVGLGALTLWGAVEYLRFHRERLIRSLPAEIGVIAALAFLIPALHLAAMTLTLAPSPALEVLASGAVATIVAYCLVALLFRYVFRIRGEAEENLRLIGRAERRR